MAETIAVIPTYNSADLVCERVVQLKESSFTSLFVCDDKSEDDTVAQLSQQFNNSIVVIAGQGNIGPGGNRNRILDNSDIDGSDFLFFIDVDCELVYKQDLAAVVAASFTSQDIGVVGFSICNKDGSLMRWNYGELMHPVHEAADQRLEDMLSKGQIDEKQFIAGAPSRAASFRLLPELQSKEVGWVAEGCFAVRTDLFKRIGGFAAQIRYHETQF
jgi:GT2 family glycosyltransferase